MLESHEKAKTLFDNVVESYQQRTDSDVYNFASLIFQRRIAIVKKYLQHLPSNGKILDFGMGPAVFAKFCVDHGLNYLGIDISPKMVERARNLKLKHTEFLTGDLDTLSNYQGQMDGVLAIGLIDYLDSPDHGLALLGDCVKSGGYLIVSFRNRHSLPRILRDFSKKAWNFVRGSKFDLSKKAFTAGVHEHAFDFNQFLCPMLKRHGFGDFIVDYFNCGPFFFNFPMIRSVWNAWYAWDAFIAGTRSRYLCSGGVMMAQRIS